MVYRKFFWVSLPVVLILSAVAGGVFIFWTGYEQGDAERIVIPLPTSELTESEAEKNTATEIMRDDLKVQILNGRGVSGTASIAENYLTGLGYKDISTDNADNFDYAQTEISIKNTKNEYLEIIKKDLSDGYRIDEIIRELGESNDYDVVIVIGAE